MLREGKHGLWKKAMERQKAQVKDMPDNYSSKNPVRAHTICSVAQFVLQEYAKDKYSSPAKY